MPLPLKPIARLLAFEWVRRLFAVQGPTREQHYDAYIRDNQSR